MFTYNGNSFAGKDDTDSVHLIVCMNKRYFFALVQSHRQTSFLGQTSHVSCQAHNGAHTYQKWFSLVTVAEHILIDHHSTIFKTNN